MCHNHDKNLMVFSWWTDFIHPNVQQFFKEMFRLYIQFRTLLWVLWDNVINSDCDLPGEDIMYVCRWLPTSVREEFLLRVWTQHVWNIGNHLWNKAKLKPAGNNQLPYCIFWSWLSDKGVHTWVKCILIRILLCISVLRIYLGL